MKKIILNSIGAFIYSVVYVLRFFNIYFFLYPNAFGHQALNVEYFARKAKVISKTDNPILVGIRHYEKIRTIANNSLLDHHKYSGLKMVNNRAVCFLLDLGLTFQKQQIEKRIGGKSSSFLTLTLKMLNTDPDVHLLSNIAFPFDTDETKIFKDILKKMSLKDRQYYIVLDRGDDYGRLKASMKNSDAVGYSYTSQHSPIEIQFKAAREMKKRNITAVKMGNQPIKEFIKSELILDYTSIYRESMGDVSDLALMNGCKFYVGTTSGIFGLATSLKKPTFLCNTFPWPWHHVPMCNTSIVMPKKLWLIKEKRMMTLCELIQLEENYSMKDISFNKSILDSLSIELILNTEDEIAGGVKEINDRIDGSWCGSNYRLSSILKGHIGEVSKSYLSTYFAENNPDIMIGINPDS